MSNTSLGTILVAALALTIIVVPAVSGMSSLQQAKAATPPKSSTSLKHLSLCRHNPLSERVNLFRHHLQTLHGYMPDIRANTSGGINHSFIKEPLNLEGLMIARSGNDVPSVYDDYVRTKHMVSLVGNLCNTKLNPALCILNLTSTAFLTNSNASSKLCSRNNLF